MSLNLLAFVVDRCFFAPWRNYASFKARGYMLDHRSLVMRLWADALWVLVFYSAIYIPLEMVFTHEVHYPGCAHQHAPSLNTSRRRSRSPRRPPPSCDVHTRM